MKPEPQERRLRVGEYAERYPERLEDAAIGLCAREFYLQLGPHLCVDRRRDIDHPENTARWTAEMRLGAGKDFAYSGGPHGTIRVVNSRARGVLKALGWTQKPKGERSEIQPPHSVCLRCPRLWECTLDGSSPGVAVTKS